MVKTGKSGLNRFKCMGRPPTKAVCLTGVLKRSGKTVDLIAFEAGLIYSSRLYKVVLDLPTLTRRNLRPPKVPEGCADAMRPTVPLKEWLQSSLFRKGHDKTTQLGRRPLVIARGAGQFEAATFPKEQLMIGQNFGATVPSSFYNLMASALLCAGRRARVLSLPVVCSTAV